MAVYRSHRTFRRYAFWIPLVLVLVFFQFFVGLTLIDERPHRGPIVPTPPSTLALTVSGLGDTQLSYRFAGLKLQEIGDIGSEITPLVEYDYDRIVAWLDKLDKLDPQSNFIPALSAYYFGLVRDPHRLALIIDFLAASMERNPKDRWRYLAHSVFLARHRLDDPSKALEIAQKISNLKHPSIPIWVRQMPAFALADIGEEEAAIDLMKTILVSSPNIPSGEQELMEQFINNGSTNARPTINLRKRIP